MNTIKGKVVELQRETGTSAKGEWFKNLVVVDNGNKFNNLIPISFFGMDVDCAKGDEVEVSFYVGGREYKGKYYAQIDGHELKVLEGRPTPVPEVSAPIGDEDDGLPF